MYMPLGIYGLALPTNLSLPNKKSMALKIFFSSAFSVFRLAKYLTISSLLDAGRLSNAILACLFLSSAFLKPEWGVITLGTGSYSTDTFIISPIRLGD